MLKCDPFTPNQQKVESQEISLNGSNKANIFIAAYYMPSFVSGQEESNYALWLATWAGKMELSWTEIRELY